MLVTDLHWENHQHNDFDTNIWNQSPSLSHQHHDVTNITVTHDVCTSKLISSATIEIWSTLDYPKKPLIQRLCLFLKNFSHLWFVFEIKQYLKKGIAVTKWYLWTKKNIKICMMREMIRQFVMTSECDNEWVKNVTICILESKIKSPSINSPSSEPISRELHSFPFPGTSKITKLLRTNKNY